MVQDNQDLIYINVHYDGSGIGRFMSADTIVPDPMNPQSFNRYAYVENRPLNFTDATGHCKRPGDCVVVGASEGPVRDSAYSWLLARILLEYVQHDRQIKQYTNSEVGIEPFPGTTLGETLWEISVEDANTIVAANGGDSVTALHNYDTLDFVANALAESILDGSNLWSATSSRTGVFADLWSGTKSRTPAQNALTHWQEHGGDFPELNNAREYARAAHSFVNDPPETALIGAKSNGDLVVYDPASDVFAVSLSDGTPRTMYKPDPAIHGYPSNLDYFYAHLR